MTVELFLNKKDAEEYAQRLSGVVWGRILFKPIRVKIVDWWLLKRAGPRWYVTGRDTISDSEALKKSKYWWVLVSRIPEEKDFDLSWLSETGLAPA